MKKRITAIVLAALMVVMLVPVTALAHDGNHDVHDHENIAHMIKVRIEAKTGGSIYSPANQQGINLWKDSTWSFTAIPDTGYKFDHWEYSGNEVDGAFLTASTDPNLQVKFTKTGGFLNYREYKAQAVFVLLQHYDLDITTIGSGTVTKNPDMANYPDGTSVTLSATPEPGWQFTGWSGSVTGTSNPVSVTMNDDKAVTATFTLLPTYTLDVDVSPAGSGTVSKNPDVAEYWQGRNVTLTASAASGWRFGSWSGDASGSTNPLTLSMDISKSVTANFIKTYRVTLNTQGQGHLDDEDTVEGVHDINTEINLNDADPDPNFLSTWMFLGWKDDATGELVSSPIFTLTSDRSFTAVFTERNYLSLRSGDHGYLANESGMEGHYAEGAQVNLNDALPTGDPGYTLDVWKEYGWNFFGSGTEVPLVDGQPIIKIGESNYFKAFFKIANYSITYDLGGGTVSPANPATYTYFDAAFNLNNPTRTGYTFAGWTGTGLSGLTPTVTIPNHSSGNRAYTANWTPISYGITYENYGTVAGNPTSYTIEDSFTLINPTREGFEFTGWTGTGLSGLTMTVSVAAGNTGARTYTANWQATAYSLSYDLDGGSVSPANPTSYTIESADITLNNPTKTGYTFDGWSGTDITGMSTSVTIPTGSIGNREYTANWTPISYGITYYNYGTVTGNPTSYTIEDSFTLINPSRTGFEFIGWTGTGLSGLTMNVTVTAGHTGARVYAANWKVAGITVTGYDQEYDASWHSVSVSGTMPGDVVTYSLDGIHYSGYNPIFRNVTYPSVTVFVKVQRYGAAPFYGSAVIRITKATLTVTANDKTITYGDWPGFYSVSYSGFKGFDNAYAVHGFPAIWCSYFAGFSGAGDYTINVEKGSLWAQNYNFVCVDGTLTVNKKALTVTADDKTITYGDDAPAYTAAYSGFVGSDTEAVLSGSPDLNCSYVKNVSGAGTYTIDIEPGTLAADNYTFNCVDGTLTVDKAALTVTAQDKSVTYGDAAPAYTAAYSGFITGEDETDLAGALAFGCDYKVTSSDAGTYAIKPDGLTSDNYDITFADGTLTVGKKALTVTADNKTVTYLDPAPVYTAVLSGFIPGEGQSDLGGALALACSYASGSAVGTYAITPSGLTSGNYEITFVPAMLTVNTLYLTVSFIDYDGDALGTDTVEYGTAATAPADPTRTGYRFTGWDTEFSDVRTNMTVRAQYAIRTYTVVFTDFDGTVIDTQSVDWNDGATAPAAPTREGYTFTGWDVAFDPVTSNLTVTALYDINTYTVRFVDFDGTLLLTQTVDWNTGATAPADPSREGYTFTGWDVEFDPVTSDLTVTAQYEQIQVIDNENVPETDNNTIDDEEVPVTGGTGGFAWWWILIIALGAALVFFLIFFVWKRRRGEENQEG